LAEVVDIIEKPKVVKPVLICLKVTGIVAAADLNVELLTKADKNIALSADLLLITDFVMFAKPLFNLSIIVDSFQYELNHLHL
jgi:hypothetical protein